MIPVLDIPVFDPVAFAAIEPFLQLDRCTIIRDGADLLWWMWPEHDGAKCRTAIVTPELGIVLCYLEVLLSIDPNGLVPRIRQMLDDSRLSHYLVVRSALSGEDLFLGRIAVSSNGTTGKLPIIGTIDIKLEKPVSHLL